MLRLKVGICNMFQDNLRLLPLAFKTASIALIHTLPHHTLVGYGSVTAICTLERLSAKVRLLDRNQSAFSIDFIEALALYLDLFSLQSPEQPVARGPVSESQS